MKGWHLIFITTLFLAIAPSLVRGAEQDLPDPTRVKSQERVVAERFMEYLEEKIVSNPLFVYVTAEEDKE